MYRQIMQCIQRKELDYLLIRFGENLKCPEKYYEDGKNQAKQIFRTLRKESSFSLKAFHIGGSFGKKTDVIEPDLDLVIIVRDCHPPLEDVLEEFKYILRWNEENLNIRYGDYKRSERSLSFHFRNGISVDLLPAANVEDHEVQTIFEKMRNNDKYAYFYSPSFVEQQIRFMKSKDSFTHTLVRISKFWFKSLYLEESFRGGSAMMELIAVASVEKARQREDISLSASQTFMIVLNTVRNLRSTRLAFKNVDYDYQRNHQVWKRVPAVELISDNFENLVPEVVGKREILERDYFITDPANPFQDYLEDKTESVIEKLQNFARITCTRLETIISGSGRYGNDIQDLFEPIPEGLLVSTEHGLRPPTNVLISYDVGCRRVYNKWKIWNEDVMNDRKARRVIKIIINKLLTVVHSTVKGDPENVSVGNVGKAVFNLIERSLSADIDDGFCVTQHRKYDVMLRVPYTIGGIGYAVCVSMTWNPNFQEFLFEESWKRIRYLLPRWRSNQLQQSGSFYCRPLYSSAEISLSRCVLFEVLLCYLCYLSLLCPDEVTFQILVLMHFNSIINFCNSFLSLADVKIIFYCCLHVHCLIKLSDILSKYHSRALSKHYQLCEM